MAINLKTSKSTSRPMPVPTEYVSVDLTIDDDDAPVDLSCTSRHVRMNSYSLEKENLDVEALNNLGIMTQEDLKKYVIKLQAELRREEANLILLQKMKLSQQKDFRMNHDSNGLYVDRQHHNQQPSKVQNGSIQKRGAQTQQQARYVGSLVSTIATTKGGTTHQQHSARTTSSSSIVQTASRHHQQSSSSSFQVNGANQQQNAQLQQLQEQQRKLIQQQQAAAVLVEQTAARRLATAKLAIQKNLERDLLQTLGPRSNPYDLSLVPNPSCPQFTSLVGLENVVDRLITASTSIAPETQESQRFLISCTRCSIDFTPKWIEKTDKSGAKVYWCEHCHRMERKRTGARQQEEKLNSAFTKAAQQEREMEKALTVELEVARQQLDAMILPTTTSASFRAAPVTAGARNSPVPGPSRGVSAERQALKQGTTALTSATQKLLQPNQPVLQKHLQQKQSSKPQSQQQHVQKSILSSHVFQQPPLDLERLMLYNEKMGTMIKQLAAGHDQSSSAMFKDRSSIRQNVTNARHAPYGRP